jgi:hypothetical protein
MDLENLSGDQVAELLNIKFRELQATEAKVYRTLFPEFRRELLAAQKAGHAYGDPESRAVWERARASWQDLTGLPAMVELKDWKLAAQKAGYDPATFNASTWPAIVEWVTCWAENLKIERAKPPTPPAAEQEEPPAAEDTNNQRKRDPIVGLLDDVAIEVLRIAGDGRGAEDRLQDISKLDTRFWGKDSPELAELLGLSEGRIRQTKWWKEDRPKRLAPDDEPATIDDF